MILARPQRRPLLSLALLALASCGDGGDLTRIQLRGPFALDPSIVGSVIIAVVHEPSKACVSPPGSNSCAELRSVSDAAQASGYIKQQTLSSTGGSAITIDGLPQGRTCFVAEARSKNDSTVGLGCAEVTLTLERHQIELEIASN
jgi:hypothetical protein